MLIHISRKIKSLNDLKFGFTPAAIETIISGANIDIAVANLMTQTMPIDAHTLL